MKNLDEEESRSVSHLSDSVFDAVVIGAGPAGLNAALVLGRARRRVLVIDGGEPRNAASHAMHGFLSRDGLDPAELRRIGRMQLEPYPDAELAAGVVGEVQIAGNRFEVTSSLGDPVVARKLLLAVGIRDELPQIAGFAPLYGNSAFHCPYCDGWEVRDQSIAVLSEEPGGLRLALLLLAWSRDVLLCTNGGWQPTTEQAEHLARVGVGLRQERIVRLEETSGQLDQIVFEGGSSVKRQVLFFHGPVRLSSSLPERLGCALTDSGRIEVDEAGRTSISGVYAAGDAARRSAEYPATQVILAAASGALAAIALHQELMYEEVGLAPALPPRVIAAVRS